MMDPGRELRQVVVLTGADIRQRVRDRTVLIFGLLVPLGLMGVFNLAFGGVTSDLEVEPVTVAISAPDDELAQALVQQISGLDVVDVTVRRVAGERALQSAEGGEVDLGMVIPADFGAELRTGSPVTLQVREGEGAGLGTDIVLEATDSVLNRMHSAGVAARAAVIAGVPTERVETVAHQAAEQGPALDLVVGEAAGEQLSPEGAVVAGQTGLFLMFTVGFGVLALLYEREQGTLARLHSMPVRPGAVVAAKALSGFLLGVVACSVLLTAGSLMFGVDLGPPPLVAVVVVAAVAAATSLTFIVVRVARTAEQAQVAQSVLALGLGIAGGAFFPITTSGWVASLLDLNPVAALIRGLGITSGGGGLTDLFGVLAVLGAFVVGSALVSRLVPDRGAAR